MSIQINILDNGHGIGVKHKGSKTGLDIKGPFKDIQGPPVPKEYEGWAVVMLLSTEAVSVWRSAQAQCTCSRLLKTPCECESVIII